MKRTQGQKQCHVTGLMMGGMWPHAQERDNGRLKPSLKRTLLH